jgi:PAS domain S-box-containing protein
MISMEHAQSVSEKAEEEKRRARLRQTDEDFRRLFDQNPLPMYIYDLETLSFLEVNQAAVERYGYSREEFLRMRITDIRPPEEVPRLIEYIAQPLSTVELPGYWRHQRRDGTLMDVNLVLLQLEFGGRQAAQVIVEDITEKLALARGQQQLTEELQRRVQDLICWPRKCCRFSEKHSSFSTAQCCSWMKRTAASLPSLSVCARMIEPRLKTCGIVNRSALRKG